MRVGIIADVHSNEVGLEEVLKDMGSVDCLLCAGDITGYNRNINEVFETLRKENAKMIIGNHDHYLIEKMFCHPNPTVSKSLDYTYKNILPDNLLLLRQLPKSLFLQIDSLGFHLFHGSPWNLLEEYIYPDSNKFPKFKKIKGDIIIMGHTHYPFIKQIGKKQIVNPGSVGQPRGENTKASYAVVYTNPLKSEIKYVDCFAPDDWCKLRI